MAIQCKCIQKFRDKNGNIKGYRLQDTQGKSLDVKPDQLKMAIFSKQVNVTNLKLTADSRLIDKSEEELKSEQESNTEQRLLKLINLICTDSINADAKKLKGTIREIINILNSHYGLDIKIFYELDNGEIYTGCGGIMVLFMPGYISIPYKIIKTNGKYKAKFCNDGKNSFNIEHSINLVQLRDWLKELKEVKTQSLVNCADTHSLIIQTLKDITKKLNSKLSFDFDFDGIVTFGIVDPQSHRGGVYNNAMYCLSMRVCNPNTPIAYDIYCNEKKIGEIVIDCTKPLDKKALQKQILDSFKIAYSHYKNQ